MASTDASRTYDATRGATFAAVERAGERVGTKLEAADVHRGIVVATTGVTIWP